jgi:PAS domain S-box-containing protein
MNEQVGSERFRSKDATPELSHGDILNRLPVAVYTCDKDGLITYYNDAAASLWGYRPAAGNPSIKYGAGHRVIMNGSYILPRQTPMAIAIATGRSFRNVEAIVERPDGSRFNALASVDPLFDVDKKIIGGINVFRDISEIREREAAISKSEIWLRQLINSLNTPVYATDNEGRITMFNPAAVELWGREPVIGKDLWCGSLKILRMDGTELPLEDCPMAVCLKEKRPVSGEEIQVVRPDGGIRHVAPQPQPLYDDSGKVIGAINLLVDITELKTKEKALLESEEKYRQLVDSLERKVDEKVKDLKIAGEELRKSEERYHKMIEEVEDYAIILLDHEGIVRNWNKGAEKIKGYKEEEIIGRSIQEFYLPEDQQSGLPLTLLAQAKEKGKALYEGWRKRKDGSLFWGSVVLTALHDQQGAVIGFSKVTRDLTAKKRAEDRMKEYMAQLEFQNKELEQFVYAASHDMKEPLRKIHLYNSYILANPDNVLKEKSKEYFERSILATQRMSGLIQGLLDYSKVATADESRELVDLDVVIDEIAAFHKDESEQRKVLIERNNLPVVRAVPFQMQQLMSNLIGNSIKYKHPGRISHIIIRSATVSGKEVPSATHPGRRYYHITVTDNGIGFNPEFGEKIFEIFQRLQPSSSVKGSGIGLAICKKIVQNHGGVIIAAGSAGKGASFSIYLPAD